MKFIKFVCFASFLFIFGSTTLSSYAQNTPTSNSMEQSQDEKKSDSIYKQKATQVSELFFKKDFEKFKEMIDPRIKEQISIDLLQQEWTEINNLAGNFKQIKEIRILDSLDSKLAIMTIEFDQKTEDWTVIFNDQQQVLGTDFAITKDINDITIEVVDSLASGKFDNARSYLHPILKEKMFPEEAAEKWNDLVEKNGKFEKVSNTKVKMGSSLDNSDLVFADLKFENETKRVLFIFDRNKKIVNIDMFDNQ